MSAHEAVAQLFVAFGRQRETDRARLFVEEMNLEISCPECSELAARNLMRSSKRMPELSELLAEAREVMNSAAHVPHVTLPQLAPRAETWWRTDAVKLIEPHVGGDRDLASFIAAQMWWSSVQRDPARIGYELETHATVWISSARVYLAGRNVRAVVEVAFRRARWASEHANDEEIPSELLNLVVEEASA